MVRYFSFLLLIIITSCDRDRNNTVNNNPYLPNYSFGIMLNMNLPQYNPLVYPSNAVYVNTAGAGIRGVIVFNAGSGNYLAYDAACPNQALASCSTMTLSGIDAICSCDNKRYSLFSGQSQGMQYPMKRYRVEQISEVSLRVYN